MAKPRERTFRPASKTVIVPPRRLTSDAPRVKRPAPSLLTTLATPDNVVRLDLPHGCFNAGIAAVPDSDELICVYRADEHSFVICTLDKDFNILPGRTPLGITNCADPRLIWIGEELLMVYSSYDTGSYKNECIRGAVVAKLGVVSPNVKPVVSFQKPEPFRISMPGDVRQKNWTPFLLHNTIFLTASVKPHLIYELRGPGRFAQPCSESEWNSPWFSTEFFRGNTNPIQLDDGNFLGTFHTVQKDGKMHYYDNGLYVFEAKPPFKVVRCAIRTFLPAEAAVEPHFRKAGQIKVCFPVSMVRRGPEEVLISYGDNDSSVKILKTTVADLLGTTVELY